MICEIISQEPRGKRMMLMRLAADTADFKRPGRFVNIAVDGCFLRRPISVCRYTPDEIILLYDIVGEGTSRMSKLLPGEKLDVLAPLGNGFNVNVETQVPVLLGGGVGVAPLPGVAESLLGKGIKPVVAMGFNSSDQIVLVDEFREMGIEPLIATLDGTSGTKGFVTDALKEAGINPDYFFACGPLPMLRSLCTTTPWPGQISLDARMACGFGVCMCCSVRTTTGSKRICKDGPVFLKNELIWQ